MSRFNFSVSNVEKRRDGIIECESFTDAVDALGRQVTFQTGDTLEIGVFGFPPAKFECVGLIQGKRPIFFPAGRKAA